jgi:uroporphyrinogen-III synthase
MRLLLTRPEPDNERTANVLRSQGHDVLLAPLLRIEAIADADLGFGPFAAILLTSANGARALARHVRRGELMTLPVLAVGNTSAAVARAAGFTDVASADGDARDLARLAVERFAGVKAPLLYLAGEDRSGELAVAGASVRTVVVYRAATAEHLPAGVRVALTKGAVDGVLHFSRRSVECYVECARDIGEAVTAPVHYCLSARAAEPLRRAGAAHIRIAEHPDEASLLALVTPKS